MGIGVCVTIKLSNNERILFEGTIDAHGHNDDTNGTIVHIYNQSIGW